MVTNEGYMFFPPLVGSDGETQKLKIINHNTSILFVSFNSLGLKDKSHSIEMFVKAEYFFDTCMTCYYKTRTIDKGENLISIIFKNSPCLLMDGRSNPFQMKPARHIGLLNDSMKFYSFAMAVIVANTGVGFSQNIIRSN